MADLEVKGSFSHERIRYLRREWAREMAYYRACEAEETVERQSKSPTGDRAKSLQMDDHDTFLVDERDLAWERIKMIEQQIRDLR